MRNPGRLLLLVAVLAGGVATVPANAQEPGCVAELPTPNYSATQMTATWAVDVRRCTEGRSIAVVDLRVTIERCTATGCVDTQARRVCRSRSGWCRLTAVAPHPAAEVAEYAFAWDATAASGRKMTGQSGAKASGGPAGNPCVTAGVVVRDCT